MLTLSFWPALHNKADGGLINNWPDKWFNEDKKKGNIVAVRHKLVLSLFSKPEKIQKIFQAGIIRKILCIPRYWLFSLLLKKIFLQHSDRGWMGPVWEVSESRWAGICLKREQRARVGAHKHKLVKYENAEKRRKIFAEMIRYCFLYYVMQVKYLGPEAKVVSNIVDGSSPSVGVRSPLPKRNHMTLSFYEDSCCWWSWGE